MAIITSAASGNWSNPASWVGGVVPTASDDVVIAAGHVVILDVDATIISLTGAAATNNWLEIQTSRTLTCTGVVGITGKNIGNAGGLVRVTGAGTTVNVNAVCTSVQSNAPTIAITAICTYNGVGSLFINIISGFVIDVINVNVPATLNIIGNLTGNPSGVVTNQQLINASNNPIINITGNLISGRLLAYCVRGGAFTVNITGNLTNTVESAIDMQTFQCNVSVTGTITASNRPAILGTNAASIITLDGPVIGTGGFMPISTPGRVIIKSTSFPSWTFQDENNNNKILYSPGTALGNPATTDVRDGISYANGALTGTLVVPSPANVRRGVPTDNTVGTADLTAQDLLDAIAASSDPVAVRLRNCATVDTTGDQIAAVVV